MDNPKVRNVNVSGSQDRHVVILIHGIRDRALWQSDVFNVLEANGFDPRNTNYGRFGLIRFLMPVPFFRNWAIREVTKQIDAVYPGHPNAHVSIIAHSFGTYVFARILREAPRLRIHRVIFCGSVLKYNFPFEQFANRFTAPILNEVGTRDIWPAMAESVTWGYGAAGTFGFIRPLIRDRWHDRAKHGYFLTPNFCQDFWVPFLSNGTIVAGASPPEEPRWWVKLISVFKIRSVIVMLVLIGLLALTCNIFSRYSNPRIVLVDSRLTKNIYDPQTISEGGTNNNDIAQALSEGSISQEFQPDIFGTLVYRRWADDNQILGLQPDVVIVHLNAFGDETNNPASVARLREFLLNLTLGTDVLLYSRGFALGQEEEVKADVAEILQLPGERMRFITLIALTNGTNSFRDADNAVALRTALQTILRRRGNERAGSPWWCRIF